MAMTHDEAKPITEWLDRMDDEHLRTESDYESNWRNLGYEIGWQVTTFRSMPSASTLASRLG